ncbi:MAG TPA: hypothetical protein PLU55_04570 [Candidatus Pacearchaeota archaeon]|nr:hypothetical protein [Candidatus Pacearchaeota archaeon]
MITTDNIYYRSYGDKKEKRLAKQELKAIAKKIIDSATSWTEALIINDNRGDYKMLLLFIVKSSLERDELLRESKWHYSDIIYSLVKAIK